MGTLAARARRETPDFGAMALRSGSVVTVPSGKIVTSSPLPSASSAWPRARTASREPLFTSIWPVPASASRYGGPGRARLGEKTRPSAGLGTGVDDGERVEVTDVIESQQGGAVAGDVLEADDVPAKPKPHGRENNSGLPVHRSGLSVGGSRLLRWSGQEVNGWSSSAPAPFRRGPALRRQIRSGCVPWSPGARSRSALRPRSTR